MKFNRHLSVRERAVHTRELLRLDSIFADLRYAFRGLRKNPGFTAVAVTTLAVSIGLNTAVFTVTKAALLAGFPLVDRNDRIVYITTSRDCCVSYPDFEDWRAAAKSVEGMAIVHGARRILSDASGFAESYEATEVSADTFQLTGQRPIIGRNFAPSDEIFGAAPVTILSYAFWERRFAKDPAIVGRTVRINGAPALVIGVMPHGFSFPQKLDLWVPLVQSPDVRKRENRETWFVFGRLAKHATIENARAEMETIGKRLENAYPLTNHGFLPQVRNFREFFIFENEASIYHTMWGAVGFVLLIACANLANLMLARGMGRSGEFSLRIALGASRWRILRQVLIESALLASLGAALAWWIAKWGVRLYELADRGPGRSSWRILDYTMDFRIFGYLIAISIGTALLFGLAPAIRLSKLDLGTALKSRGRSITRGRRGKHVADLLVSGEMALAVVLLAGAGVMVRAFLNIYNADLGVKGANVLTMAIALPVSDYPRSDDWVSFFELLKARLEAIPGVESMAIADHLPASSTRRLPYEIAGAPPGPVREGEQRGARLSALVISPVYFRTLGASMLSGRDLTDGDHASGVPVVLVNQRFANKSWPREDPVGRRLRLFDGKTWGPWLTIVGVAPNILQNDTVRQDFGPLVYLPFRQNPAWSMEVIVRTRVRPENLATAFRREIQALDPGLPIFGPLPLAERLKGNYWSNGLYGVLFLIFAVTALLLASIGLYAVIAHSVNQRTQEMGIRMAIGASSHSIFKLVVLQGMLPSGIGLGIGLTASPGINRILKAQLVQVSPADPITLVITSAVLVLSAMLGCWIPAQRAMRVDPVLALRQE